MLRWRITSLPSIKTIIPRAEYHTPRAKYNTILAAEGTNISLYKFRKLERAANKPKEKEIDPKHRPPKDAPWTPEQLAIWESNRHLTYPNQIRALKEQLPELTGSQIRWRIHSSGDFEDPSTAHTEWTKDEIDMMQWCIDNNRKVKKIDNAEFIQMFPRRTKNEVMKNIERMKTSQGPNPRLKLGPPRLAGTGIPKANRARDSTIEKPKGSTIIRSLEELQAWSPPDENGSHENGHENEDSNASPAKTSGEDADNQTTEQAKVDPTTGKPENELREELKKTGLTYLGRTYLPGTNAPIPWSDEELARLEKMINAPVASLLEHFPGRTLRGIKITRKRMRLAIHLKKIPIREEQARQKKIRKAKKQLEADRKKQEEIESQLARREAKKAERRPKVQAKIDKQRALKRGKPLPRPDGPAPLRAPPEWGSRWGLP
ncbi:Protein of unknown function [Pyronema omphalodes CBS 100304]|uniref:Uncharacterized protein n=1 Tax=Pyronema omphalodes (strain CBS 100304) TaxID=1076935 RepID=U4L0A6_PYROM|nr:Protein of unknown function [Pyronema omphalodes CBS 100304]